MIGHTLVLNRSWIPVNVISPYEVMILLCRESAEVIDPETYETYDLPHWIDRSIGRAKTMSPKKFIKTPRCSIEKPEVILLKEYYKVPFTEVNFTRRNLYKRDNYTCLYCGMQYGPSNLSIDHVFPQSKGGKTSWVNCATSCKPCNSQKSNMTLTAVGFSLQKKPKKPQWLPISGLIPNNHPRCWGKFLNKNKA